MKLLLFPPFRFLNGVKYSKFEGVKYSTTLTLELIILLAGKVQVIYVVCVPRLKLVNWLFLKYILNRNQKIVVGLFMKFNSDLIYNGNKNWSDLMCVYFLCVINYFFVGEGSRHLLVEYFL